MKKLISTALMVIMIVTCLVAALPVNAFAAVTPTPDNNQVSESEMNLDEVKAYIDNFYLKSAYSTAEEMLDAMINDKDYGDASYLVSASSSDGRYSIYINRYTGFVFYVNNKTGQILTSNPIDPAAAGASGERERSALMSQIKISFSESSNSKNTYEYDSTQWAARYGQISVSKISGGLRVNYTLGDTSTRFLLPGRISAADFHDYILYPMAQTFQEKFVEAMEEIDVAKEDAMEALLAEYKADTKIARGSYSDVETPYYEYIYSKKETSTKVVDPDKVKAYLSAAQTVYTKTYKAETKDVKALDDLRIIIMNFVVTSNAYTLKDIDSNKNFDTATGEIIQEVKDNLLKEFPVVSEGPIYVFDKNVFANNQVSKLREYAGYIKQYCPDYSFEMMYEDEKECGFEYDAVQKPVFRCALEYTFNSDGSLSVSLPANSIVFDETAYNLTSITPLQYFGCGDMTTDGYVFYPDGSGSILEYSDFYTDEKKVAVNLEAKVYGQDYCYSSITGKHREQITMPIYGIVTTAKANATTTNRFGVEEVKNGCFVIIEEGDSLASLGFESGGSTYKYISAFASYNPFPSDKYELSETVSVGSAGEWNVMVGENRYSGNYVSRIVMLTDSEIGDSYYGEGNYYDTTYNGMAAYYRTILKANGTLTAIENIEKDIPLYIETLGAMTITTKFLTFPVEESIPLTTFSDIVTMYNELSTATKHVVDLRKQYEKLASEAENELLRIEYEQKAAKYKALEGKISDIKNINFKLTGFANGGMNYTYPTDLKWEDCCGGEEGFESLIQFGKDQSAKTGYNLGIYPDFDFLYINNTAAFDGISNKGNVSRMIDNRYASKQVYDSILGEFVSFFSMVISTDTLGDHYATFNESYAEYGHKKISIATLGSDLNSNFDEENTIDREASKANTSALFAEIAYQSGYNIMTDTGNIYAAKYADHILNASIDFSSFRFSSYAIPFVGMILHGHVSYSASPLNYSGSPDYDILRAIESGANPYYIVSYQNTAYMKDDEKLNKYYGIDYTNWYDEILLTYDKMNSVLRDLQTYEIVAHTTVLSERTADAKERMANYEFLKAEVIALLRAQLAKVANAQVQLSGASAKLVIDEDALYEQIAGSILVKYNKEILLDAEDGDSLKDAICQVAVEFATKYSGNADTKADDVVTFNALISEDAEGNFVTDKAGEYVIYTNYREYSAKSYTTDSTIMNYKDYDRTEYTLDNDNVVMVTYKGADGKTVSFVLNYNLYEVDITLANGQVETIPSYGYYKI